MDGKRLKTILKLTADNLFKDQSNIFRFTAETRQTEWNLACHFANELHILLPDYDYDLDVTKRPYGNRRPDIIFHKRGTHDDNFLVLEIKNNGGTTELKQDIQRIKKDWFSKPLCYKFGATVNFVKNKNPQIKFFQNIN